MLTGPFFSDSPDVPTFKWLSSVSGSNDLTLGVTFPDGSVDEVLLQRSQFGNCNYLGRLKRRGSSVAVTGCRGSGDLQVTITGAGGGQFKWSDVSTAVVPITSPFGPGNGDATITRG